jgi:hypothetical protein
MTKTIPNHFYANFSFIHTKTQVHAFQHFGSMMIFLRCVDSGIQHWETTMINGFNCSVNYVKEVNLLAFWLIKLQGSKVFKQKTASEFQYMHSSMRML